MDNKYPVFYSDKKKVGALSLFITFVVSTFVGIILLFGLVRVVIPEGSDIFTFITLIFAIVILFIVSFISIIALFSLPNMRYELRDDALYLIIGPWKDKIPYNDIVDVKITNLMFNPLSSFRMPGIALFNVRYLDEGSVKMYSTHPLSDVVLITTTNKKYGISPKDEDGFIAALQNRIKSHKIMKIEKLEEKEPINNKIHFGKLEIVVWLIVAFSFIIGAYLYSRLPQEVAVHWGSSGKVNGYLPKFLGVFISPILFALLSMFPIFIPRGSSRRSYIKFRFRYYIVILVILGISFFAYLYMLLWNIGIKMNFNVFSSLLIGGIAISIIMSLFLFLKVNPSKK